MSPKRWRRELAETRTQIEALREQNEALQKEATGSTPISDELDRRMPRVESLVEFLVGRREQNGFGRDYRITALTRSDAKERHA